ncbi:MAG: hypothetical protein SFY66_09960 [Oculatellaceae cyanobacterium bins.114]|nr:hypothetical protein [Oculatellaceae cyanobacterium bins.114]
MTVFTANQVLQQRYELQRRLGAAQRGRQTWLAKDLETQPHKLVIVKLLIFNSDLAPFPIRRVRQ